MLGYTEHWASYQVTIYEGKWVMDIDASIICHHMKSTPGNLNNLLKPLVSFVTAYLMK